MVLMGRLAVESVEYGEKKRYKFKSPLKTEKISLKKELKKEEKFLEDDDDDDDDDEIERAIKKKRKKYI